jgi:hypothetical protein
MTQSSVISWNKFLRLSDPGRSLLVRAPRVAEVLQVAEVRRVAEVLQVAEVRRVAERPGVARAGVREERTEDLREVDRVMAPMEVGLRAERNRPTRRMQTEHPPLKALVP